ncbi:hypothetical protein NE237_030080 [Protea cynaroides]|uniref:Uncharacterized protein n=1 Tax=Protea cynaroides TaxID=273540 RepID=A0A9Q0GT13_9MAGN|nr:hypothetical protein NE237_030080 [Protea cynaroides]
MSSKILASAGAFLVNRFLTLHLHRVSNSNLNICSLGSHFSPKLMPTLSKLQNSPRLPKLAAEEFPYPYGLPSLRFFLPDDIGLGYYGWVEWRGKTLEGSEYNIVHYILNCWGHFFWVLEVNDIFISEHKCSKGGEFFEVLFITTFLEMYQLNWCFYFPKEHTNLAMSSGRGPMDTSLVRKLRVDRKSLPGG